MTKKTKTRKRPRPKPAPTQNMRVSLSDGTSVLYTKEGFRQKFNLLRDRIVRVDPE